MKTNGIKVSMITITFCALAAFFCGSAVMAQDGGWPNHKLTINFWANSLNGDVGPEHFSGNVEADFDDLINKVDMAWAGTLENQWGKWGLLTDTYYIDISESIDDVHGHPYSGDLKNMVLSMQATYNQIKTDRYDFEWTFGLRYNETKVELTPYYYPTIGASMSWVDPVVGFKGGYKMSDRWTFNYLADVGGFGIGSDITWTGLFSFDAQLAQNFGLTMGYKAYHVNNDETYDSIYDDDDKFEYQTTMYGPYFGLYFNW